ncbi:hypothetical protein [Pseudoduganella rhizocola]|uniref:hypothetical protein n=1 Tax=Pseudoduganella rhizocola TaxID=3382643 RepID=UPI0038B4FDBE
MASYKQRYNQFQADVDAHLGRPLGRVGKIKAFFGSFSDARKAAIDHVVAEHLYQPINIIGTTSQPGQRPTVYYRRPSGTFGHITQEHDIAENVGRMKARKTSDYTIGNTGVGGAMEESAPSIGFYHPSRNPLRNFADLTLPERHAAEQVHLTFSAFKDDDYA